jgi:hypothetical protein
MESVNLWQILSAYPTSIYTVMIGVLLVFWLFAILGALDMDIISFDADVDIDLDLDADIEIPGFVGLLHTLGFTGVPFTIVLSVLIFLAWVFTYTLSAYLLPFVPGAILKALAGTVVLIGSFLLAVPITTKIVAPLRKLSVENKAKSNKDYLGGVCKVTSLTVDESFGQGKIQTTGTSLVVRIRADAKAGFKKGDIVRPISYDKTNNAYQVISNKEFENNLEK